MGIKIFELKDVHIKLLSKAHVDWNNCEFGAPTIDPKRPYGSSFVWPDLAESLGLRPDYDGDWSGENFSAMMEIHKETQIALQIFLKTGKMETGVYEADEYSYNWKKIG
jgi:hypothetical protein